MSDCVLGWTLVTSDVRFVPLTEDNRKATLRLTSHTDLRRKTLAEESKGTSCLSVTKSSQFSQLRRRLLKSSQEHHEEGEGGLWYEGFGGKTGIRTEK